jgi:hypothetical protein
MKFEIRWTPDDKPMARRVDGHPMTDEDRNELRMLIQKMNACQVCFNCGSTWSVFTKSTGEKVFVCWVCAKSA